MKYRINYKMLCLIIAGAVLVVLLIRGTVISCRQRQEEAAAPEVVSVTMVPTAAPTLIAVDYTTISSVKIKVYMTDEDKLVEMPLEEYLVGVVSGEMPASYEFEALKAQAVASRTYSVYSIIHHGCGSHEDADICTNSSCCQAYSSLAKREQKWGDSFIYYNNLITRAVLETANEVLLYEGRPIEALYHAASGGYTENSENVYSEALPYLRSVLSDNETGSRQTGSVTFAYSNFVDMVNLAYPQAELTVENVAREVEILSVYESGRVESLRLGQTVISGKQARRLFSLDSTMFEIELLPTSVTFNTKGFGHGVGLSQSGANGMAQGGSGYLEILLYYYTGVELGKLTEEMMG
ncbi:MAG TPA: stage II sporulation protein D [Clostridia bacterium]|nr:stage II sporulation protein D [Clostridia bacterium]